MPQGGARCCREVHVPASGQVLDPQALGAADASTSRTSTRSGAEGGGVALSRQRTTSRVDMSALPCGALRRTVDVAFALRGRAVTAARRASAGSRRLLARSARRLREAPAIGAVHRRLARPRPATEAGALVVVRRKRCGSRPRCSSPNGPCCPPARRSGGPGATAVPQPLRSRGWRARAIRVTVDLQRSLPRRCPRRRPAARRRQRSRARRCVCGRRRRAACSAAAGSA